MTAYGDDDTVQKLVFGVVDNNEDTRTANARTQATYFMNAKLGLLEDLTAPDDETNNCCNFLAAGLVGSSPENVSDNINWKIGLDILKSLMNRSTSEKPSTGTTLVVDRF
jgi:hypothetical protein